MKGSRPVELRWKQEKSKNLLQNDLAKLIKMILTKNNFIFGGDHYLQLHGTAMGTKMASSYAKLFMGRLETHLLEVVAKKPSIWWQYIDDVFTI